jgi:hypothetical protein
VIDFVDLRVAFEPIFNQLDHYYLRLKPRYRKSPNYEKVAFAEFVSSQLGTPVLERNKIPPLSEIEPRSNPQKVTVVTIVIMMIITITSIRKGRAIVVPILSVGCTAVLLRIREVPRSNLGSNTDYPDRFSWLSSVPSGKYWDITSIWGTTFPSICLPIHYSL